MKKITAVIFDSTIHQREMWLHLRKPTADLAKEAGHELLVPAERNNGIGVQINKLRENCAVGPVVGNEYIAKLIKGGEERTARLFVPHDRRLNVDEGWWVSFNDPLFPLFREFTHWRN